MTQILLIKGPFGFYHISEYSNTTLDVLADFFCADGSDKFNLVKDSNHHDDFYIGWLKNPELYTEIIGGNTYKMTRKNGKVHLYFGLLEGQKPEVFKTTPETMRHVLIQWYDILATKPRPSEVVLIQDGNIIFLVPKANYSPSMYTSAVQIKN